MATGLEICTDALLESRVMRQAGQTPPAEQVTYALARLNRILGSLSQAGEWYVYTTNISSYTLSPTRDFYTIGPTGNFVAERPMAIDKANIIISSGSNLVRVPLEIISDEEWADISVVGIGSAVPVKLYNDGAAPNSNLYLWPKATNTSYKLELFWRQQLTQFSSTADTLVAPNGYQEALTLTLAEALANALPGGVLTAELKLSARMARNRLRQSLAPLLESDYPVDSGLNGTFNYISMTFNKGRR